MRAAGSRECAPGGRLREAMQISASKTDCLAAARLAMMTIALQAAECTNDRLPGCRPTAFHLLRFPIGID
jgi:hypothetical protein